MKLITRDTAYAIKALCFISKQKKKIVSVKELVGCLKVPKPFSRKIMQLLNKKGFVKSYRGSGGGFMLTVNPYKISILDLIETFQGSLKLNEHTFRGKVCPEIKLCPLKKRLDAIERDVILKLRSISIGLLLSEGK